MSMLREVPTGTHFEIASEENTGNIYRRATLVPTSRAYAAGGSDLLDRILEFNKLFRGDRFCLIASQSGVGKIALEDEEVNIVHDC